jgi:integrase
LSVVSFFGAVARWSETDFDKKFWTIPAEREEIDGVPHSLRGSKMKTPHLVPLSDQSIDILKQIYEITGMY